MKLDNLTTTELEALAYRLLLQRENINQNLQIVTQEIAQREQQAKEALPTETPIE